MDESLDDLKAGRIQFRDKWQFELKTDLFPDSISKKIYQIQEFYFFIPNALQINSQTYKKEQFYLDQTNLIRFKTPTFTFSELSDPDNSESPFVKILMLADFAPCASIEEQIQDEIKLTGNIFHSALRNEIAGFVGELPFLKEKESQVHFSKKVLHFCEKLQKARNQFCNLKENFENSSTSKLLKVNFDYIDEYISNVINDYLLGFLNRIRTKPLEEFEELDKRICEIILREKEYRKNNLPEEKNLPKDRHAEEYLLYRKGLLNKFLLDPLLLKINRSPTDKRFRGLILGIPAAIAMTIFLTLYVLQGNVFLLNSEPFILLTVIIYVLKDRLKEELRVLSYRQVAKWFSDYVTEIRMQNNDIVLGKLNESFSFVEENKVPKEIIDIRNREFHAILEEFKRPEQIIYYKQTIQIGKKPNEISSRFYAFNTLFRFDVHHFLSKAEDPNQFNLDLNSETHDLNKTQLPRVYHVNIILKTTTKGSFKKKKVEFKKFRLVVDKNGIRRVEDLL